MMRILLFGLVGYVAYRVGREFVESVPSDFEPVPALPSPDSLRRADKARRR